MFFLSVIIIAVIGFAAYRYLANLARQLPRNNDAFTLVVEDERASRHQPAAVMPALQDAQPKPLPHQAARSAETSVHAA